jgi:hypothetical protein
MASASYIRKRREIQRQRSALGVAARQRKRLELAEPMRVVAEVRTSGSLGDHHIELLSGEGTGPTVWVRFDGEIRRPRTARGFVSLLGRWVWKSAG